MGRMVGVPQHGAASHRNISLYGEARRLSSFVQTFSPSKTFPSAQANVKHARKLVARRYVNCAQQPRRRQPCTAITAEASLENHQQFFTGAVSVAFIIALSKSSRAALCH
eukprot:6183411-Pleurochrysis_carterae.AAC.1